MGNALLVPGSPWAWSGGHPLKLSTLYHRPCASNMPIFWGLWNLALLTITVFIKISYQGFFHYLP